MSTRQGVGTGRIVQTRAYTCRTCRVVGGRRRVFRKGRAVGQTPDAVASTKRHTAITRRQLMGLAAVVPPAALAVAGSATARAASSPASAATIGTYDESVLPTGIRSRFVPDVNGLRMHLLEAGYSRGRRPATSHFVLLRGRPQKLPRCRPTTSWSSTRDGGDSGGPHAVTGRDRRQRMAARRRAPRLQRGVRADGVPGWPAVVSVGRGGSGRDGALRRPYDRHPIRLHCRGERLGSLSAARLLTAFLQQRA